MKMRPSGFHATPWYVACACTRIDVRFFLKEIGVGKGGGKCEPPFLRVTLFEHQSREKELYTVGTNRKQPQHLQFLWFIFSSAKLQIAALALSPPL